MVDREGNLVEQVLGWIWTGNLPAPWLVTLARSWLPDALALEDAYPAPQQTLNWHLTWLPMASGCSLRIGISWWAPVCRWIANDALRWLGGSLRLRLGRSQAGGAPAVDSPGATSLVSFVNEVGVEITVVGEVPAETASASPSAVQPLARNEAVR